MRLITACYLHLSYNFTLKKSTMFVNTTINIEKLCIWKIDYGKKYTCIYAKFHAERFILR